MMNKTTTLFMVLLLSASFAEAQTAKSRKRIPAQTETTAPVTDATPEFTEAPASPDAPSMEDPSAPMDTNADAAAPSAETSTPVATPENSSNLRPRPKRLPRSSVSSWAFGVQSLQWTEPLTVSQLGTTAKSNLNFNGIGLALQKETYYLHWGWNVGGLFGVGRANGGPLPDSSVIERKSWNMLAFTPRVFWRLTNTINVGGTAMVYIRNIDLPEQSGTNVTAGRKNNASILADMTLRIFKEWDFYQAIGPAGDGVTLWKIGVNYRF